MLNVVDSFWGSRAKVAGPGIALAVEETTERIGVAGSLEWLVANTLNIDHDTYQRVPNEAHVNRIARDFDPDAFGVLTVSERRDKTRWILDGQHRALAVHKLGWSDQRVPCVVLRNLSLEDEARVFYKPQVTRRTLTPAERFRAKIVAGDATALEIQRIARANGYEINVSGSGNTDDPAMLTAIGSIEKIVRQYGIDDLSETLRICRKAWPNNPVNGTSIQAVAMFLSRAGNLIDERRLIGALSTMTPTKLERDGREVKRLIGGKDDDAGGFTIHKAYNHKLQSRRLPDWTDMKKGAKKAA